MEEQKNISLPVRVHCQEDELVPEYLDGEDHREWLTRLSKAFGTEGTELAAYILGNLARADGKMPVEHTLNSLIAAVQEAKPRDTLERILLVQMFLAAHRGMTALSRSSSAMLPEDAAARAGEARRFMYLYARQLEALRRYRNSGQQTITVVHADKAIVGNVVTAGGTE